MSMTTQEIINVLVAYQEGKKIEYLLKTDISEKWEYVENPVWDFYKSDYRIKPKELVPHYRWFYIRKGEDIVRITKDHFENPHMAVCSGKLFDVEQVFGYCEATKIMK